MAMLDRSSLHMWILRFHDIPVYYEPYGLKDIFMLTTLWEPDIPFMSHMRARWNPHTSSFILGDRQFCPTVEEFRAIMMLKSTSPLRLKPFDDSISFKKVLRDDFACSKNVADVVFKGNVMHLQRWHDTILRGGQIPHETWTTPMLITIFLAHYLMVPAGGQPSVKVFDVTHQLRQGARDIAGIVLAETIMGLNAQAHVPETEQRGSSFVLYMWLADKLRCVPPVPPRYITDYIVQKARLKFRTTRATLPDDARIHETTPWHNISEMVHSMDGMPRVIIMGLERATSYFTTPLSVQFGRTRMPLADLPMVPFDVPITMKLYNEYPIKWMDASRLSVPLEYKYTIDDYIKDPTAFRKKLAASRRASKRPRSGEPDFGDKPTSRPRHL